jgi:hypothetical protein
MLARGTGDETQARSLFEASMLGRITPSTFAEWVYTHPDLARIVGYADEEDLLTFDYQASDSAMRLPSLLRAIYRQWWPGPEATRLLWQSEVVELIQRILRHSISLPASASAMTELSMDQDDLRVPQQLFQPFWDFLSEHEYLSEVYYDLDKSPRAADELAHELVQLEAQHRPAIEDACQQILKAFGSL